MTPSSLLARKRALLQLAGGAMPDTSEVEVAEVPIVPEGEAPEMPEALPAPSRAMPAGEPEDASKRDLYGEALGKQRTLELLAGLSRAGGSAIQAISGVAPSEGGASAIEQQAKAPVVEYLQRMKLADTERQRGIQEARATRATGKVPKSADPTSPESQHAQEILGALFPNRFAPEQLAKFSAADIAEGKLGELSLGVERVEAGREREVGVQKRSEAERLQRAQQFAAREGREWAHMSQTERLAAIRDANKDEAQSENEVDKLRKEFMGNKVVKDYQDSRIALDKVERAASDPSAAGDLALIFGYMKTLDPGSTVREGEFANAQNAGGIDSRIMAAYNKVLSGERLTGAQRQDFIRSARTQFGAHRSAFERLRKQYGGLAPEGLGDRVTLPADGLDLSAPATADAPASASIKEKVDLADGTTIITYADGRVVKRVPKKKGP